MSNSKNQLPMNRFGGDYSSHCEHSMEYEFDNTYTTDDLVEETGIDLYQELF